MLRGKDPCNAVSDRFRLRVDATAGYFRGDRVLGVSFVALYGRVHDPTKLIGRKIDSDVFVINDEMLAGALSDPDTGDRRLSASYGLEVFFSCTHHRVIRRWLDFSS